MAGIAEVIKSCLQRKSKFIKIKNKLSRYTIHELRAAAKLFDIKAVGRKDELFNKINNHLNNKILLEDNLIELERNAKRRDDKKPYRFNIIPELKKGLENEIKENNEIISDLQNQFNTMRNKDIIELKKFLKSKQITTAGNYNEVKNKVKNYFNKQVEINKKVKDETQKLIRDLSCRNRVKKIGILTFLTYL